MCILFFGFLQLFDTGVEVLLLYGDRNMETLVSLMSEPNCTQNEAGDLAYHIELIRLLGTCTEGKNDTTEIKCHCLLPLYDVIRVITHKNCIPEVCMCGHCMYLHMHVCMYVLYVCTHTACTYVCMHVCMYCMYAHSMYLRMYVLHVQICVYVCLGYYHYYTCGIGLHIQVHTMHAYVRTSCR